MCTIARRLVLAPVLAATLSAAACGTTVSTSAVQQSVPASGDSGLGAAPAIGGPSAQPGTVTGPGAAGPTGGAAGVGPGPTASGPAAPAGGALARPGTVAPAATTGPLKVRLLSTITHAP